MYADTILMTQDLQDTWSLKQAVMASKASPSLPGMSMRLMCDATAEDSLEDRLMRGMQGPQWGGPERRLL